jgi:hypothetical protein
MAVLRFSGYFQSSRFFVSRFLIPRVQIVAGTSSAPKSNPGSIPPTRRTQPLQRESLIFSIYLFFGMLFSKKPAAFREHALAAMRGSGATSR